MTRYVAIDIETGGLDPACSVLEVAIVPIGFDLEPRVWVTRPKLLVMEPEVVNMHTKNGLLQAHWTCEEVAKKEVRAYLSQLVMLGGGRFWFVGFCPYFDAARLELWLGANHWWRHRLFDPRDTYGFPPKETRDLLPPGGTHRALADAMEVVQVMEKINVDTRS